MWESPHDRPSSGLPYTPGATEARAPRGRRIAADFVPFDAAVPGRRVGAGRRDHHRGSRHDRATGGS